MAYSTRLDSCLVTGLSLDWIQTGGGAPLEHRTVAVDEDWRLFRVRPVDLGNFTTTLSREMSVKVHLLEAESHGGERQIGQFAGGVLLPSSFQLLTSGVMTARALQAQT